MSFAIAIVTDLAAIIILAYALYFRRHQRRDLMLSYIALNVGVVAVTIALSSVEVGIGLGIGLFGILSIIRLRSDQITQQEIAYYFVSLALGLLAGLRPSPLWITPALSALVLLVMVVVDSPRVAPRARRHSLTIDRAFLDESALTAYTEQLLGARVTRIEVLNVDLVRDVTMIDVRYRVGAGVRGRPADGDGASDSSVTSTRVVHAATAAAPSAIRPSRGSERVSR